MPKYEGGVLHYSKGYATIEVNFPEGNETCEHCEFLYNDKGLGRARCELTHGRIIPLAFVQLGRPDFCPLKFNNGKE